MSNKPIVPCLWFDDQAEQAARFYSETFQGSRVTATSRYPESSDNPSGKPPGSVLTVELDDARHRVVNVASELKVLIVEGERGIGSDHREE